MRYVSYPSLLLGLILLSGGTAPASPVLPLTPIDEAQHISGPLYGDPPDTTHPWGVHDRNRPQPQVVETAGPVTTPPPSDAVVLFDGSDLSGWKLERPKPGKNWITRDGYMECMPGAGNIVTRELLADCQLHIEWAAPAEVKKSGQGRGNSGVFFMGTTEIQILDNYQNASYPDGMAGAIYGVNPPLANALRPPGEFNSYDVVFRRPLYRDGVEIDPGYFTVFCNGVLIQDHCPLEGGGGHKKRSQPRQFPESGPLKLQDHGNPVRFRNIWYRPLPPRAAEGGTSGALDPEVTTRLREEIAEAIRQDAAELTSDDLARCYRLMESLAYAHDDEAVKSAQQLSDTFVAFVEGLPGNDREQHKQQVLEMRRCLQYMEQHSRFDAGFTAKTRVDALVEEMGWDPKKKK